MTEVAILYRPSNFTVMACTTKLPVDYFDHIDFVSAGLKRKAKIGMADLAAKTYPMKPMGKNNRTHPRSVRVIVDHNVAVLGSCVNNETANESGHYKNNRPLSNRVTNAAMQHHRASRSFLLQSRIDHSTPLKSRTTDTNID
jgi:hypothetical protein